MIEITKWILVGVVLVIGLILIPFGSSAWKGFFNKYKGLIAFIGAGALVIVGGFLLHDNASKTLQVTYRGNAVFTTEEEYVDFKEYVTQPRILIRDMQVLASDPPIWVSYCIEVPREFEPPPACDSVEPVLDNATVGYCAMIAGGIVGVLQRWSFP